MIGLAYDLKPLFSSKNRKHLVGVISVPNIILMPIINSKNWQNFVGSMSVQCSFNIDYS